MSAAISGLWFVPACRCAHAGYLLRVIGASVFPGIPQAMTNAATIALAEKASDLVLAG
jgi:choline dehydrogenase-like flavoprotein